MCSTMLKPSTSNNVATSTIVSSWSQEIRSAAESGRFRHALSLFIAMLRSGNRSDPFAFAAALKVCGRLSLSSSMYLPQTIHAQLEKIGFQSHIYTQTALVDVYSKFDGIEFALKVFDEMPMKNVVSWNSMLSSCVRAGQLGAAQKVFDEMPVKDVISWNSIVCGFAKAGDIERAAELFSLMPMKNAASWNAMLCGYIGRGDMTMAREFFDAIPVKSNVSWIMMISSYAQYGDVESAREVFEQIEDKDIHVWNAMIACYTQNGFPDKALQLFNWLKKPDSCILPDRMTFSSIMAASSQLGNLRFGLWIEEYMFCLGIEMDDHLRTSFIDLYSKSGKVSRAFELFNELGKRDLVAYSAMILGCGINGRFSDAISLFEEMLQDKISPNAAMFTGLLTAYNYAGLVEEGLKCFDSMMIKHNIAPTVDHYAIMVDLLGRSGKLEEALDLIRKMPMHPHAGVWGALLLASRIHGNVEMGEIAAQNCFSLEPEAAGYYLQLASIYAEAEQWDKCKILRKIMVGKRLNKVLGCSWVQT